MKKIWLFFNVIMVSNCFTYDNQTEIKRSLLPWLAVGSAVNVTLGLFSLARALKTIKKVHDKEATWKDEATWDGREIITLRSRTICDIFFGSLFSVVGSIIGGFWIHNYILRKKPIVILNDQGFIYEDRMYALQDIKSCQQYIINGSGSSTTEYMNIHMKNGSMVRINMDFITISYNELKTLLDFYYIKNKSLYAAVDFSKMDESENNNVIKKTFCNLASKIDNNQVIYWYDILGVKPTASEQEIKTAYKKLALKLHPDKNQDPDAASAMKIVSNAHNYINRLKHATDTQEINSLNGEFDNIYRR